VLFKLFINPALPNRRYLKIQWFPPIYSIRVIRLNVSVRDCERKRSSAEGIKSSPREGCAGCAFTNDGECHELHEFILPQNQSVFTE